MPSATEVFDAIVRANDESTPVLKQIEEHYKKLGIEIQSVEGHVHKFGHETERVGFLHREVFEQMGEHVHVLKEHYGEAHESLERFGEGITELLPAITALGAAASVAGVFEAVAHTADSYGELVHQAEILGTSARNLQVYSAAAKLADTNIEAFQKSAIHLNRVLAEAASGKNKDAAALFAHLKINPASFHDAIEALPVLADAFEHTRSAAMRTRMSFTLFGKSGAELIPVWSKGGEHLKESLTEAGKLVPDLTSYGEGLEKYNEGIKGLQLGAGGFADILGAKLEPALDPAIEKLRDYIVAHRDELTDKLTKGVSNFADTLEHTDWTGVTHGLERVGTALEFIGDHMKVIEIAAGVMAGSMALRTGAFFVAPIWHLTKLAFLIPATAARIASELVPAWNSVRAASVASGEAQLAAAGAGVAGAAETGAVKVAAGSMLGRVGAAALGFVSSWPVAGGIIAHELDSNDAVGKWIDHKFAWATAADDWVSRHTGGWVGRSHEDNAQLVELPARTFGFPAMDLPRANAFDGSLFPTLEPLSPPPPLSRPSERRVEAPSRPAEVDVTIRFQNAPPGTQVTATRSEIGRVRVNLGQAWYDDLGTSQE